ncbi:hypothetical protein DPMN_012996 [Dreissena polymorpha]|uniref:Uncharacterized protein n=1 Tax=Dreissena polymorpha TaxID=45954 RepID=A0A9D4N6K2_DREPO|nr:hypothetical protein DPMN_012996 [Dreissena polymorpha]
MLTQFEQRNKKMSFRVGLAGLVARPERWSYSHGAWANGGCGLTDLVVLPSSRELIAGLSRSGPMGPRVSACDRGRPSEHGGPSQPMASKGLRSADYLSVAAIYVYRNCDSPDEWLISRDMGRLYNASQTPALPSGPTRLRNNLAKRAYTCPTLPFNRSRVATSRTYEGARAAVAEKMSVGQLAARSFGGSHANTHRITGDNRQLYIIFILPHAVPDKHGQRDERRTDGQRQYKEVKLQLLEQDNNIIPLTIPDRLERDIKVNTGRLIAAMVFNGIEIIRPNVQKFLEDWYNKYKDLAFRVFESNLFTSKRDPSHGIQLPHHLTDRKLQTTIYCKDVFERGLYTLATVHSMAWKQHITLRAAKICNL